MLQKEKEQLAKEKVLSLIDNIPQFTHIFLSKINLPHIQQSVITILFFMIF